MTSLRTVRWLILIVLQAVTVAWAYTAIHNLLGTSPSQQQQLAEYGSTSQPVSAIMRQTESDQAHWGRQSLFAVACCFLVLMFVIINWVSDGRSPPPGNRLQ